MSSPHWNIWIDTGGTFTDCLAQDPDGKQIRLKILSSSLFRGSIKRIDKSHAIQVEITWPSAIDIFKGFTFRITGASFACTIDHVDIPNNLIYLQKRLAKIPPGTSFEITSHEEVPVLAVRLITSTGLGKKF